ncbi:hypothetical protein PV328_008805 [Microctonus aethiopoides]|uniref:Uncharacterized protein n=1 Tax=Microctonus aethiopoides TaxID=144406 RepID=A0AA39KRD4_9HYME|nr:hypothetical protein PV328_008805 [Microctonus aethiopoides]
MLSTRGKIYAAVLVFAAVAYVCQGALELPEQLKSLLKMVYTQDQIEPALEAVQKSLEASGFYDTQITEILDIYRKLLTDNLSGVPVVTSIVTAVTALQKQNIDPALNQATLKALADYFRK